MPKLRCSVPHKTDGIANPSVTDHKCGSSDKISSLKLLCKDSHTRQQSLCNMPVQKKMKNVTLSHGGLRVQRHSQEMTQNNENKSEKIARK